MKFLIAISFITSLFCMLQIGRLQTEINKIHAFQEREIEIQKIIYWRE